MSSVMMSTSVSKAMNAFSAEVIRACALKYGFDGEEAMRELSVSVASSEGKKSKAKKDAGPKAAPREMPSIPLPFTGVVREDCCSGVKQNHGLYTQCFSAPGDNGLCKGCNKQASKNASGEPDCGLIAKRVMQGSEYRDAKGRAPVHYTKVMKKQKLTEEQVLAEAAKFNIEIEASHFAAPDTKRGRPKKATTSDTESETSSATGEKKTRGRPKKAAKVVEVSATEDLFASLMQQAQSASPRPSAGGGAAADEMSDVSSNSESESDSESKGSKKKTKKSKEESEEELADKAAKFLAKEEEKEKKAAAKAAEKEAEKQKKAAEKEAEKAKKLQEKEAEKAKKEAEKEAEKAKKLAEKEAAKTAKEEKPKKEKASKKKAEEPVKPAEPVADLESEAESEDEEAEEPTVTVKKFEHEGVIYLKSGDGVLYDAKTQSVVGKWNETTKSIDVHDGESEEEEDSDSDSDEE